MSYTTTTLVQQFLGRTLTENESNILANLILPSVDLWIDRTLNSHFGPVDATTRYFEGGTHSLDIGPVQDITAFTSLQNDGTTDYTYTDLTEYTTEPSNGAVKTEIILRGTPTPEYPHRFSAGLQRYAVTGKFTEYDYENDQVPADIRLAATRIASGVLAAGKAVGQGGNIQSESLEGHSVTYDSSEDNINTIASSDPILQGILGGRREIYV